MSNDKKLVLDALYYRELQQSESCLVSNTAGETLRQSRSASILPVIEQVLQEIVEPALLEIQAKSAQMPHLDLSEWDPIFREIIRYDPVHSQFPGLPDVLGAYLIVGTKFDPDRMVHFLSTLSPRLLVEAIESILIFFSYPDEGYDPGIPPSRKLIEFVKKLEHVEYEDLRSVARRVREKYDSI
jgi:hypothetical protein